MKESEWLTCNDVNRMLLWANRWHRGTKEPYWFLSDRKCRLFAIAAASRAVKLQGDRLPDSLTNAMLCSFLRVCEDYADGLGSDEYMVRVRAETNFREIPAVLAVNYCAWQREDSASMGHFALNATRNTLEAFRERYQFSRKLERAQGDMAALLRNVLGNPWKKKPDLRSVLQWNDRAVPRIAGVIYAERRWELMPQLGDALEEAGCEDETMLRHCRSEELCSFCMLPNPVEAEYGGGEYWCPGCGGTSERGHGGEGWMPLRAPHVPGDWVVDWLLGKN